MLAPFAYDRCSGFWPFALSASLLFGCGGSRHEPERVQSAGPCHGAIFDADAPDGRCLVRSNELIGPPPEALSMSLRPATVESGARASFLLEMKNVSGRDLTLDVHDDCLAFDAVALNGDIASFESECGGLCGQGPVLRVTLAPNGVIKKRIAFSATMRRIEGERCAEHQLGDLPPGRYTLRVMLPWTDPDPTPDDPAARSSRFFETALNVAR